MRIAVFYVDFWLAYPRAIKAIYPDAVIQYDFFHVIQNVHRQLYKALTAYRKAFKAVKADKDQEKIRKALHTKLWQNRYVVFTNDEHLTDEQRQTLDELLEEHTDTIVEQIVVFRQHLHTMFNESETFTTAMEHLATLILDGWADLSATFGKVMTFLQEHFVNICTYLRIPNVQRNSLSECTIRSLRRIEHVRQGFKTQRGRVNHLKLLQWRTYMCATE